MSAVPTDKFPRIDFLELHARDILRMPPTWRAFLYQTFPTERPYGAPAAYFAITGAVPTDTFTRGPRKGQPNWKLRDKSTELAAHITPAEDAAFRTEWEQRTGHCWQCCGNGTEWCGWSEKEGSRYRECTRCASTGIAPTMAQPKTP